MKHTDEPVLEGPAVQIPLSSIEVDPRNARRKKSARENDDALAQSIARLGLLQPVTVRRSPANPERYRLLFGSRRFAAVSSLGHESILARVLEDVDDDRAEEIGLAENIHREQLDAFDEASRIAELMADGADARAVAARLNRSVKYVARRAQLAQLSKKWRKAIADAEHRCASLALPQLEAIALLTPARQDELLESWRYRAPSPKEVRETVAQDTRKLASASWKLEDAELSPKDGACVACPRTSAHRPGLFDDGEETDGDPKDAVCLDEACWFRKLTAHRDTRLAAFFERHGGASNVYLVDHSMLDRGSKKLAIKPPKGVKVHRRYDLEVCKKTAKGARPAMVVAGDDAGRAFHARPWGGAREAIEEREARRRAAEKPDKDSPAALKAMRDRLQRKRRAYMVDQVREAVLALEFPRFPSAQSEVMSVDHFAKLVDLGMSFGFDQPVRRKAVPKGAALAGAFWGCIRGPIATRLFRHGSSDLVRQWKLARQIACALLGPKAWEQLEAKAIEDVPAPKSIERLAAKLRGAKKQPARKGRTGKPRRAPARRKA